MKSRKMLVTAVLVLALALAACGAQDTATNGASPPAENGNGASPPAENGNGASPPAENGNGEAEGQTLQVAAAEQGLEFQETELTATAGQPITVEFTNPAALEHNWVLVEPGQEEAIADTGQTEGEGVIAGSNTLQQGESDTVEIDALEAGEYTYICTVPGHSQNMRGTLVVE